MVKPLANDFVKVAQSPDPKRVFCYSPGILDLGGGSVLVTMEYGGPGRQEHFACNGQAFLSRDGGRTFEHTASYPISHARPFKAGKSVYILGHAGDLAIVKSADGGKSFGAVSHLTKGMRWHQAPCNVLYDKGYIYLVMEKICYDDVKGWCVSALAPVLMRAKAEDDLLLPESWTYARAPAFRDAVREQELDFFGVPFYDAPEKESCYPAPGRDCAPMGWLETNIVKIVDPNHYWFDPAGRTYHLIARAHTGGTGYAAYLKVTEQDDGSMTTDFERMPSGKRALFLPLPGGQMKFHILYDEATKLYWLLSSQATDSMTRAELLPKERYNLPNNERHRLQIHFSKNCVDWCFAGMAAIGETPLCSRHYASMAFCGTDLLIASRSGDQDAYSAHNGNFISLHTVKNFRELVY